MRRSALLPALALSFGLCACNASFFSGGSPHSHEGEAALLTADHVALEAWNFHVSVAGPVVMTVPMPAPGTTNVCGYQSCRR